MALHVLSVLFVLASSVVAQTGTAAGAQASVTPLVDRRFTYPNLPYQVDPTDPPSPDGTAGRGPQQGFNLCNSTTATQDSMCQTSFVNSLDDFCIWGPPKPNSTIGDTEGESVAWCTQGQKHGTRTMPAGTITGAQFLRAPAYVQVTGTINQVNIDMTSDDGGGELDPHGADFRGNPLGGLIYSNAFPSNGGNNNSYQQVIEWHNFMGSSTFCIKVCDPAVANSKQYCQNIFDRIGCEFNAPASYAAGEYTVCDSENQDPPGVYTDASGAVQTFSQPPESLGPISSMPYTAKLPKSSNCVNYESTALFAAAASVTAPAGASSTAASGSASVTGSASGSGSKAASSTGKPTGSASVSGSKASSAGGASSTSSPSAARPNVGASGVGAFIAVAMSVMAGLGAVVVAL